MIESDAREARQELALDKTAEGAGRDTVFYDLQDSIQALEIRGLFALGECNTHKTRPFAEMCFVFGLAARFRRGETSLLLRLMAC